MSKTRNQQAWAQVTLTNSTHESPLENTVDGGGPHWSRVGEKIIR